MDTMVLATPHDGLWLISCSRCGPLAVSPDPDALMVAHFDQHALATLT